jgi:hypothetical protein
VRAQDGWVDARLAFASDPALAQAYGGALTTSRRASLAVKGGHQALVDVRGRLLAADGRVIASNTQGYRWVPLPSDIGAVRCDGLCAVALEASVPEGVPPEAAPRGRPVAIGMMQIEPWLATARIAPGPEGMLRLNDGYDRGWALLMNGKWMTHFRVDAATNGWLLPERTGSKDATIVEWPSAVVAAFEIVGAGWTLALLGIAALRGARRKTVVSASALSR